MSRSPLRLGDILASALRTLPAAAALADFALWTRWEEIVGEALARHARPVRIRRGVLLVHVDDSVWMQELQFLKHDIRDRLNTVLGRSAVREIFLALAAD